MDKDRRGKEEIKANITRAARLAKEGATHPDPVIRSLAAGMHEVINCELDRLDSES
jgi:hypothetical protein